MPRKKIRIAFVRRGFSPSGGAEHYLRRLAKEVISAGHEPSLFTNVPWENWPGLPPILLNGTGPLAFADELAALQPEKNCDLVFSFERIRRCDLFRAGDGVHRAWVKRRSAKATAWQRVMRGLNRKHREILQLEDELLGQGRATRVIANSRLVYDEIVQEYGYPAERINIVPNGVRVSEFGPAPGKHENARVQLKIAPDQIAVLFAGSGWERKGLRYAIAALEKLKDDRFVLLVAGRGSPSRYRSRLARFLGETEIKILLAAADIFILPTLYDPFSNASLEAMAAGLPVITTKQNGCSEIMEPNVHGSVVQDAGDVDGLVSALQFWSPAAKRADAREEILERATQFDLSRNVAQTLEVIHQSIAEGTSG